MRKITLMLMLAVVAVMQCNAQLLWKITGNGLAEPSYIFGTNHMAPVAMADTVSGLHDALESVGAVYGELSLEDIKGATLSIASALKAPADSTLAVVFTPAELAEIDSAFASVVGMPLPFTKEMNAYKPIAVNTALIAMMAQKYTPDLAQGKSLDMALLERGSASGKKTGGLEPLQLQIDLLYNTPIATQADELLSMIRVEGGAQHQLGKLFDAYTKGDLDALYNMIDDPASGQMSDQARRDLIDHRNEAWVDFLLGLLPTTSVLVVCGAGHLAGPKGLISLLRGAGYEVVPAN